ncbi:MAG: pentapeptide repeat-containing protein [Saprospiraceae bacterium]|nr:pentapeptide repeat-containing protein [Bacteroidia bacterium]NNF22849.1 pentapeptide repeat-containing protein [Saprospiraceae bacterium]NNK89053.1 pentapeptide repeat-containing protein [Saprospiraceae bacterium]
MDYITEKTYDGKDFTQDTLKKGEYELCIFINCNFSDSDLSDLLFIECEFIECNLSNCKLYGTSFQEVKFSQSKMLGLQFDSCNDFNLSISFECCKLDHSVFQKMNLSRSSFDDCQMEGVDFEEAEMMDVKLLKCDLLNANFDRTNLENADLSYSRNYRIDPERNNIKGARFSFPEVAGLLEKYNIIIE